MSRLSIVVGLTKESRCIGSGGGLLFHVSDDLKRFRRLTWGHPLIMGRKTYESIGKALPGRTNIIITRNESFEAPDCVVVNSLEAALAEAKKSPGAEEIFIGGGGEIYKQALPDVDRLYLTLYESEAEGDVFFPTYEQFGKEIYRETEIKGDQPYSFVVLEK